MKQYHDLLKHILKHGTEKSDRTGTGTTSVFGYQMRFDLSEGFPLVTTKKVHMKAVIHELLWFLKGDTNIKYLNDNGVHIWDEWARPDGGLGPVYGKQWRSWEGPSRGRHDKDDENRVPGELIDQIDQVIQQIKTNPDSRRLIVSAWNPGELEDMKLPPCHLLFQFYVRDMTVPERLQYERDNFGVGDWTKKGFYKDTTTQGPEDYHNYLDAIGVPRKSLSCQLYQRSADVFLGVPFNIASYALLTMMVAQVCNLAEGEFIHTFGDAHLYSNHMGQVQEQLSREIRPLPKMSLNPMVRDIDGFKYDDFLLVEYNPHPAIKAPVAV